ncbi:hypothetical protein G3I30_13745 [Actinospica acidiphila]|nr:hypothetical protein [Actinospica acidiphila]
MTRQAGDWGTIWQRRLRHGLTDHFANVLARRLNFRVRSFQSLDERVLAQRTIPVGGDLVFLSLEVDEFPTPQVRLVGSVRRREALRDTIEELERAVDGAEKERDPSPGAAVGAPLWVPYRSEDAASAMHFLQLQERPDWSVSSWPAALPIPRPGRSVASLGVIVDSLEKSVQAARARGGDVFGEAHSDHTAFVAVTDPAGFPLLLMEMSRDARGSAGFFRARVEVETTHIDKVASFYGDVAHWWTEVLPDDSRITALLTHQDRRVGVLTESTRTDEQTLAILVTDPRQAVQSARGHGEFAVRGLPLVPLLGRSWQIDDAAGHSFSLAEVVQDAPRHPVSRQPWSWLPPLLVVAVEALQQALDFLERMLREILLEDPQPSQDVQVSTLLGVLSDTVAPATRRYERLLYESPSPALVTEALTGLRTRCTGLFQDLAAVVQSLEDDELIRQFRRGRDSLVHVGLLPDTLEDPQGAHVVV